MKEFKQGEIHTIGRVTPGYGLVVTRNGQVCFYEYGNVSRISPVLYGGKPIYVVSPEDGEMYFVGEGLPIPICPTRGKRR